MDTGCVGRGLVALSERLCASSWDCSAGWCAWAALRALRATGPRRKLCKAYRSLNYFFPDQQRAERDGTPIPPPPAPTDHVFVFHCEYSQERGPRLLNVRCLPAVRFVSAPQQCFQLLREMDRKINQYPTLSYPQLYILDLGYKNF